MTSAIARWHSSARPPSDALELAYADRLEAEMQELAIQLHKVSARGDGEWAVCRGHGQGGGRKVADEGSAMHREEGG